MKKRSAITAAAAASLAFGGAAAAAVSASSATSNATEQDGHDNAVDGTIAAPAKPKVVTVYVDAPDSTAGVVAPGGQPSAAHVVAPSNRAEDTGTTPAAPTPGTAAGRGASHDNHRSNTGSHESTDGHDGGDESTTTSTPPATTVPPVTTTTGGSGTTCDVPNAEDCETEHDGDHDHGDD